MAGEAASEDFVVQIDPITADGYPVRLVESPWGQAEALASRAEFAELKDLNRKLQIAWERGMHRTVAARNLTVPSEHRDLRPEDVHGLSRFFGKRLFDIVIQGDIRRRYDRSIGLMHGHDAPLRILLRLAPREWADLHVELLFDGDLPYGRDRFLCRGRESVLSRYPVAQEPGGKTVQFHEFRILVAIACPSDRPPLAASKERMRILEAVRTSAQLPMRFFRLSPRVRVDYVEHATYEDLRDKLLSYRPHAVHFIGHAWRARGRLLHSNAGLALEDQNEQTNFVSGENLAALFGVAEETLQLLYLNACETASICQDMVRYYGSFATIGTQTPVDDNVAVDFASRMYTSLLSGTSIDRAVAHARQGSFCTHSHQWMVYVLALHTQSGQLVSFAPAPELARLLQDIWKHIHDLDSQIEKVYLAARDALVAMGEAVVGFLVTVMRTLQMSLRQRERAVEALGGIMAQTNDVLPVRPLADVARDTSQPATVREKALDALAKSASEGRKALVEIWFDDRQQRSLRDGALEALDPASREVLREIRELETDWAAVQRELDIFGQQVTALEERGAKIVQLTTSVRSTADAWSDEVGKLVRWASPDDVPSTVTRSEVEAVIDNANHLSDEKRSMIRDLEINLQEYNRQLKQSEVLRAGVALTATLAALDERSQVMISRAEQQALGTMPGARLNSAQARADQLRVQQQMVAVAQTLAGIKQAVQEYNSWDQTRAAWAEAALQSLDGRTIPAANNEAVYITRDLGPY